MRIAVAGGGIFGQVIAWRLALRGCDVVVCEPRGPGNAASASGDRSRIVRALYDERCFAESGHASLALWDAWSKELGARLVETIGVLYFDRDDPSHAAHAWSAWLDRGKSHLKELGARFEELSPREVAAKYPAVDARDLKRAILEPAAGFGRPALAAKTIALAAARTGRVEHRAAEVARIFEEARGVTIVAREDGGERTIRADKAVIAAGFAGAALAEALGCKLPLRRLPHWTSYWDVPFPDALSLQIGSLPAFADLGAAIYGFPDDGESGFKIAWHEPRREEDDAHAADTPDASALNALRDAGAKRFPGLARATPRSVYECAYDATPDEMFLIGPLPTAPLVYFAGGFSGHGYKHAPALGEAIAAELLGQETLLDLSPYRIERKVP